MSRDVGPQCVLVCRLCPCAGSPTDPSLRAPLAVVTLFPLVLPSVIPLLPLPARLRNPRAHRQLFIIIVALYLVYSLVSAATRIVGQPSFYDVLDIDRLADPADVSAGWKAFARRNHPDRQRGAAVQDGASDDVFRIGRVAYDTLSDDGHRWAYDRFGPDSTRWWARCASQKEFLRRGLQDAVGFYVSTFVVYGFMALTGTGAKETSFVRAFRLPVARPRGEVEADDLAPFPRRRQWRYLTLPVLLALELSLVFSPTPGSQTTASVCPPALPIRLLSTVFPGLTQHGLVLLLRNLATTTTMFLNQLGPLVLVSVADGDEDEAARERRAREEALLVQRLGLLVKTAELEGRSLTICPAPPSLSPGRAH